MKKVRPGELWSPSAERENAAIAAHEWTNNQQRSQFSPRLQIPAEPDVVRVANRTCDDWDQYDVVELATSLLDPVTALPGWSEGPPVFRAVTPTATGHGRIAILTTPVAQCQMAVAVSSGVVRTKIDVGDATHRYALAVAGSRVLQSSDDPTAPIEILWAQPGTGEVYAIVRMSNSAFPAEEEQSPTTTTTTSPLTLSACEGQCKYVASATLQWTRTETTCSRRTTTTTTAEPTTTTTYDGTTEEPATPTTCCPDLWQTTTSAGTTDEPTTTTTADDCDCLWPTFCPEVEGQCTYTSCAAANHNQEPICTTTPSTTTTCDCESIANPCGSAGCDYVAVPNGDGGHDLVLWSNGCTGAGPLCECEEPVTMPDCGDMVHTNCLVGYPPYTPVCQGECKFYWVQSIGRWWGRGGNTDGCTVGLAACDCPEPSTDGNVDCEERKVPCGDGGANTTTTAYDYCQYVCHGSTTTPGTTTTPDCDTGGCIWLSNGAGDGWVGPYNDTCPEICACREPARVPQEICEVYTASCSAPPTTTTVPPTTTTGDPTSTTTGDPTSTTTTGDPTSTTTTCDPETACQGQLADMCGCTWVRCGGTWQLCTSNCGHPLYCSANTQCPDPVTVCPPGAHEGEICSTSAYECVADTTTTSGEEPSSTTTNGCMPSYCEYNCQDNLWVQVLSCAGGCYCNLDSSVTVPCFESDPNLTFDCLPT